MNHNEIEDITMFGQWTVESENITTGQKKVYIVNNMLVQGFYTLIHRFLSQDQGLAVNVDDMNLSHVGLGLGTTAVTRGDTTLENEQGRKETGVKTITNDYQAKFFLDAGDGNFAGGYIKEIGLFCKGTGTANSGTMISRALVNIQKNENIRLTLSWTLRGQNV